MRGNPGGLRSEIAFGIVEADRSPGHPNPELDPARARDAWPLVNIYNTRLGAEQSKELANGGRVPAAPLNRIVVLTDYVAAERIVACPNQDVVRGGGSLGLEQSRVVIQVLTSAIASGSIERSTCAGRQLGVLLPLAIRVSQCRLVFAPLPIPTPSVLAATDGISIDP